MIKVLLENREEIDAKQFLTLTEEQFRLLVLLKRSGWLEESVDYIVYDEDPFMPV